MKTVHVSHEIGDPSNNRLEYFLSIDSRLFKKIVRHIARQYPFADKEKLSLSIESIRF